MFGLSIYSILARVIVIFTSLPLRKWAQSRMAAKMGDTTALFGKQASLNPLDHIDPIGALMILLVGIGFTKPVHINPYNFRNRKQGIIMTSLAGSLANFALATVSLIIFKLLTGFSLVLPSMSFILTPVATVFSIMVTSNLTLGIFTLLPIPPLDGWKIASVLMPPQTYWKISAYEQQISLVTMVLVFTGVLSMPISFLAGLLLNLLNYATFFIDIIITTLL